MKLFAGKTVRRNVTIDAHIADNLSALSKISRLRFYKKILEKRRNIL